MLTITGVEQVPKKKQRYYLYVNDAKEPFTDVHEDLLIKFRLLKGREIDAEELKQIVLEDSHHRAYILALAYLGARQRTEKEITRYLSKKELDEQSAQKAIERLRKEGLVNDPQYAELYAAQRMRTQLKGRRLLQQELLQRGIKRDTAKEAAAKLSPESETEMAVRAALKKWPSIKGEERERKQKLAVFLLRRGFPSSIVREAVKAASEGELDDEDGQMLDN
ncbi:RecX family transcriptional regulator [Paenibacillus sacheonensis]|uniref:Regulatory protein RecX n=1 Tax=Paenibacillus sacheonensis TaxID=742054 RepID=A0A7X5BWA4_9BACL|nr:RecX family transcriptional regulator [Paenibacillus sacheonensis]MBM7564687.1 regulatory protein [Paenibacillus sacheonensis]NBC69243.1 RecX family transcriptional regulator [Paenibacillus sacheonensis]